MDVGARLLFKHDARLCRLAPLRRIPRQRLSRQRSLFPVDPGLGATVGHSPSHLPLDGLPRRPVRHAQRHDVHGEGLLEDPLLGRSVLAETGGATRGHSPLHRLPVLRYRAEAQD